MQVTTQCRVEAPSDWVRSFLIAGAAPEDVSVGVGGDVVEVRQRDRLIDLVVRTTLTPLDGETTRLDMDATLHLRGLARLVGGVFSGRVRRTLARSLEGLPVAIQQARDDADRQDGYAGTMLERTNAHREEVLAMTDETEHTAREPEARTLAESSKQRDLEADSDVPQTPGENLEKATHEAAAGEGPVDAARRVGRELDRTVGGEYEAREDAAAAEAAERAASERRGDDGGR